MKNKLLIIACLVIVLSMALILPLSIVNADYSDIQNNPNAIVNFNQYVNFTSSASNLLVSIVNGQCVNIPNNLTQNVYCEVSIPFVSNHKYYFYCNNWNNNLEITNSSGTPYLTITSDSLIFTSGGNGTGVRFYFLNGQQSGTYYYNFIDLTQMFGSGNEPNLQQCKDLFVADSYSYNTGNPVSISGISSYQDGFNDALSMFEVVQSSENIVDSIFNVNAQGFSKTYYQTNQAFATHFYNGIIGVPLGFTLLPNDLVTIDITDMNMMDSSSYHFEVGYFMNSTFVPIQSFTHDDVTVVSPSKEQLKIVFNVPVEMNTIYFQAKDISGLENHNAMTLALFTISCRTQNAYSGIKDSYDLGFKTASDYYLSTYAEGGYNYNRIYYAGYTAGVNTDNPYTFSALMTSVVEAPVNAVLSMFNFDFLGYNFKNVITLIITVCIIIAIIRLFIGMGASE